MEPAIPICLGCAVKLALRLSDRFKRHRLPLLGTGDSLSLQPQAPLKQGAFAPGKLCCLADPRSYAPLRLPHPHITRHFGLRLIGGLAPLEIGPGDVGVSRVTYRNLPCMPPLIRRGAGAALMPVSGDTPVAAFRR